MPVQCFQFPSLNVSRLYDAFRKDCSDSASFLLNSGAGRYSILGFGVKREWMTYDSEEAFLMLEEMREFLRNEKNEDGGSFASILGGYLSYDFGADFQKIELKARNDFSTPLLHFVLPKLVLKFDHCTGELFVFGDVGDDFAEKVSELNDLNSGNFNSKLLHFRAAVSLPDMTFDEYASKIDRIHELLRAGETYEVNFAQRFCADFEGDPFQLYSRLMSINPAPYSCYLDFKPIAVASCSPELLIRGQSVDGGFQLETRPIKGTIARGSTPQEDRNNIEQLLSSEKDEAELNMIVDLERNDFGKVCEFGSVEVNEHRVLESYSHVHHTMSNVRGILKSEYDWLDVLKAVFPGGSVTGAPKKRTMKIIDRLELCRRGIYTGSAGYIAADGSFEFNILIRTIALNRESGRLSFHAGGAIVMDSEAEKEYEETLIKARALAEALAAH